MIFKIITTQSTIYDSFLKTGLIARAILKKIIKIDIINLYDFGLGTHKTIDDTPYGGGPGMVLRADVIAKALAKLKAQNRKSKIILLTPQGKKFNQKMAKSLAKEKELVLISGRFEGYDERIRALCDEEISMGDFVLTSGDLPAMTLIDAVSRQISGFIDKEESIKEESFNPLEIENCKLKIALEYPQYTRPEVFNGQKVPDILISGDHQKIALWRKNESRKRTQTRRPDLLK